MSQEFDPNLRFANAEGIQAQPAGFWIRFVAVMIDGVILAIVNLPITLAVGAIKPKGTAVGFTTFDAVSWVLSTILAGCYYAYFYSKKGATPGKSVLNLRIVDTETGANPSFSVAFWRETVGKTLSLLSLCIGYLMAAFSKDKKALHDRIFHTQVIKIK